MTTLRLRGEPEQRLDLSDVTPERLSARSAREIAGLPLATTRVAVALGDAFEVTLDDPDRVRIVGGSTRLDRVGQGMGAGEILVEGDVGWGAGLQMRGGRLTVFGSAAPLAGGMMEGGVLAIEGDAGASLGGAAPGAMAGMRGGFILVGGAAGERAGDRMHRGVLAVLGRAGRYAGSRMRGGTLLAPRVGDLPGYLMKRGTIMVEATGELAPTFVSSGPCDLPFFGLLRRWLAEQDPRAAALVPRRAERLQGDMASLGRGEIFIAAV